MSRLTVISNAAATPEQKELLDAIQSQLGMVPNFLRVFANSPVALRAFLGLHGIANEGVLDALTRERIALALAQANGCQYCVSAHTAIGRKVGLTGDEIVAARSGTSEDAKAAEAVKFARSLVEKKGEIDTAELMALRNAGYTDAAIVEMITHVGMNFLTNLLGKASRVEIDFPTVDLKLAA
ncbi:MAG: peroxidase [Betaproteobacteria bacterium HGW-Betaproteobacteria-3]|jgi:uncharacterized peroxidase-related enzyme|nr:MAG: peroxidase [Betaproteobacteria bacterium HGW-Betaproteobacteria-3]